MKQILENKTYKEVINYFIFGVLTTLVYIVTRWLVFTVSQRVLVAAVIANVVAIVFAFITNDKIVFKQVQEGQLLRFIKFVTMRLVALVLDLLLAYLFVKRYPGLIGYFVNNDIGAINLIETLFSQGVIIILNYILSKFIVFK
ncbi:GtrA family protein [Streptococcus catagoni]|uniref:GtrA family protein n=1 Tax=Streptococcus catagoni TaxID=2654874 RepID=UPI00140C9018|nr:GtrA family protein [Streptococcus catagoni]